MVRRTRLGILLLISVATIVGCEKRIVEETDDRVTIEEEEKMSNLNVSAKIMELLECNEKTAKSIINQCHLAGIEDISAVEKEADDVYMILKLSTEETIDYYVFLSDGFFLEQIRKGSESGEQIYMAME